MSALILSTRPEKERHERTWTDSVLAQKRSGQLPRNPLRENAKRSWDITPLPCPGFPLRGHRSINFFDPRNLVAWEFCMAAPRRQIVPYVAGLGLIEHYEVRRNPGCFVWGTRINGR